MGAPHHRIREDLIREGEAHQRIMRMKESAFLPCHIYLPEAASILLRRWAAAVLLLAALQAVAGK